ncbi:hypothetical protein CTAYLR_001341 [Chrysophaeum taylorii]|uniref:Lengsin n=1 Tax=Chrysophaeum taylorii TaxID=2483200 RepID=A0AAD7XJI9_9STRA|nr:hypothetical protein CTAYLR_001341 [Chrysophaeum taylorii]
MNAASFSPRTEARETGLLAAETTAVLVVDVQNYCCHREGADWKDRKTEFYWRAVSRSVERISALIHKARKVGVEVMYTVIESLTLDGRDRSLDYKISGFNVPRGSWAGRVVSSIAPAGDEIVFPKTSCDVFVATNIDFVLRNLGTKQLVICGGLTDQCVESATRHACDRGYLVTLATDACYAETQDRQDAALRGLGGFCRQREVSALVEELDAFPEVVAAAAAASPSGGIVPGGRRYVRFELADLNCKSLSKVVPDRNKEKAVYMYSGVLAMGANSEVLCFPPEIAAAGCPNFLLDPKWETATPLPWAPEVVRVICEMDQCPAVPRTICRRLAERLKRTHGLEVLAACEYEFTVAFEKDGSWAPAFDGVDIFATLQHAKVADLTYEIEDAMHRVGVDILTINAEYGPQLEMTFKPAFGVESGDQAATFKEGVKEICMKKGLRATFMTKPFGVKGIGNGGHWNHSLWKDGRNATGDGPSNERLSSIGEAWVAGILKHAPALEAICAPTPPCYCRHGNWAPTHADWGYDDRMAAVRVKRENQDDNFYVELRMPSASSNPYLVMAATIAAGLDGLDSQATLPPDRKAAKDATTPLPTNLEDALRALEQDAYMQHALGPDFVRWFTLVKRAEIETINSKYRASDTDADTSRAWQRMYMEYI